MLQVHLIVFVHFFTQFIIKLSVDYLRVLGMIFIIVSLTQTKKYVRQENKTDTLNKRGKLQLINKIKCGQSLIHLLCQVMKPLRSKHCAVCNKCVAKFDHFCPWVYNAVGAGNHKYFIGYLFFLLGLLTWHVWACFKCKYRSF